MRVIHHPYQSKGKLKRSYHSFRNQTFIIIMNHQSRVLPPLNLYYLQRKAYQVHLKNISHAKHSLPPRQNLLTNSHDHLSPLAKRIAAEKQRQNLRLFQKIHRSSSTISRKEIQHHSKMNRLIKQRICKFTLPNTSERTQLKSQLSLDKLEKKDKRRHPDIRAKSVCTTLAEDSERKEEKKEFVIKPIEKQNRLDRLLFLRNSQKIKNHFEQEGFALKARNKLSKLTVGFVNDPRRVVTEGGSYRNRCFATQASSS